MASERKKSSSSGPSVAGKPRKAKAGTATHFVICVRNDDHPASLELRKLYPVLDDAFADEHEMVRVIDESGEDYLYPMTYFVRVELPASVERTLAKIA
jgi:hypothetical protein